jgi:hypothetical protein
MTVKDEETQIKEDDLDKEKLTPQQALQAEGIPFNSNVSFAFIFIFYGIG